MAGPAFQTGFTKIEAPKLKDYGAALNPLADNFKRLSDIENKKKELDAKRAFQVSREEAVNQWQKDANKLQHDNKVLDATTLYDRQVDVADQSHQWQVEDATTLNRRQVKADGLKEEGMNSRTDATIEGQKEVQRLRGKANVKVANIGATSRNYVSNNSLKATKYRVDHKNDGIGGNGSSSTTGKPTISLVRSERDVPNVRAVTLEEFIKKNPDIKKLNALNINKHIKISTDYSASSDLDLDSYQSKLLKSNNPDDLEKLLDNLKGFKGSFILPSDKNKARTNHGGNRVRHRTKKEQKEYDSKIIKGKLIEDLTDFSKNLQIMRTNYQDRKGTITDGVRKETYVDYDKSNKLLIELGNKFKSLTSKPVKSRTKSDDNEILRLKLNMSSLSKQLNNHYSSVDKANLSDKLLINETTKNLNELSKKAKQTLFNELTAASLKKDYVMSDANRVKLQQLSKEFGIK